MRRSASELKSTRAGALALALCCLASGSITACAREPEPRRRPNLLLISLDSTRRDYLGCYGCRPKHAPELSPSPNIDRLAAHGVKFENAHASTSWTLPSHMSLFTGLSPLEHAVELDSTALRPHVPTLATILRKQGYRTAGFASGPYLAPQYGFDRGFDRYELCYGRELAQRLREEATSPSTPATQAGIDDRHGENEPADTAASHPTKNDLYRLDVSSQAVTDAALAELRSAAKSAQPWFLFAHYFDPHYDYVPPSPFDRLFDPDYTGTLDGRRVMYGPRISREDKEHPGRRIRTADDRDFEHLLALYQSEIAWTDSQIGRLLQEIEALGLTRDTLVVITADHGDEFFEHGGLGHRRTLDEEVLRVPLIVSWPGTLPEGKSVSGLVSNCDVLPTLMELFGIPGPADISGASFAGLARGLQTTSDRSALARIVAVRNGPFPLGHREPPPGAQNVYVIESFLCDGLKLTREREWFTGLPAPQAALERVQWIDLERSPEEPATAEQAQFTDPRAEAALRRFRSRYALELGHRSPPAAAGESAAGRGDLAGLGYTQSGTVPDGPEDDFLRTPAPSSIPVLGDRDHPTK